MSKPQIRPLLILLLISTSTLFFLGTHFTICLGISDVGANDLDAAIVSLCGGNTSECTAIAMEREEIEIEIEMEPSVRRRSVLMMDESRFISYATLRRDLVPCRRPGASYYNCRAVEDEANPYTRGCEIIAGCARSISGDGLGT